MLEVVDVLTMVAAGALGAVDLPENMKPMNTVTSIAAAAMPSPIHFLPDAVAASMWSPSL